MEMSTLEENFIAAFVFNWDNEDNYIIICYQF